MKSTKDGKVIDENRWCWCKVQESNFKGVGEENESHHVDALEL